MWRRSELTSILYFTILRYLLIQCLPRVAARVASTGFADHPIAHSLPPTAGQRYAARMSSPASDPENQDDAALPDHSEAGTASDAGTTSAQPSDVRSAWVGGHFDPAVVKALKTLALREGTTVQALIGRALNNLLEPAGLGRPASETVLPRGGAAHRRKDRQPR